MRVEHVLLFCFLLTYQSNIQDTKHKSARTAHGKKRRVKTKDRGTARVAREGDTVTEKWMGNIEIARVLGVYHMTVST